MQYPSGREIRIGDIIWWNEGAATGVVADVLESPASIAQWGIEAPGIFVCCNLDQAVLTRDLFINESLFLDEGIERKTSP